jgi:hypothetical protein
LFIHWLSKLQEFSFIVESKKHADAIDSIIMEIPFTIPSLRVAYFGGNPGGHRTFNLQASKPSGVTHLTIEQSYMTKAYLTKLLQCAKALESLTFTFGGQSENQPGAVDICNALQPHQETLRTLYITGYFDTREEEAPAPLESLLAEFHALEDIAIAVGLLGTRKLVSVFPKSVVKLRLHFYDEWRFQYICEELDTFLKDKEKGLLCPHLKYIWIEYVRSSTPIKPQSRHFLYSVPTSPSQGSTLQHLTSRSLVVVVCREGTCGRTECSWL